VHTGHEEDDMALTRIPAVPEQDAGFMGRLAYRYARRRFGAVPEPFLVSRHHRGVFWASALAETAYQRASTVLPTSVRELAVYRTATAVGCQWCVDFGTMLQRLDGLDVDRLTHIEEYATSPLYSRPERLAIAYADAMTAQPPTVTDEQVAELEGEFGRAGLVELTTQIGLENMRARVNHALGITGQGFDAACKVRLEGAAKG
jgi:AhpD family alkylhydroperoxidase